MLRRLCNTDLPALTIKESGGFASILYSAKILRTVWENKDVLAMRVVWNKSSLLK